MMRWILLCGLAFSLTACLRTRSQIQNRKTVTSPEAPVGAEKVPASSSVVASKANYENQFAEIQTQIRELVGRVEVLEKNWNLSQDRDEVGDLKKQMSAKMALYEEALVRLEKQVGDLAVSSGGGSSSGRASKNSFEQAEVRFKNKSWRKAILAYQEYRDKNPKGKNYPEATYKIGVCFQELGLKKESKAFYNEVVSKFPKSRIAKKARYRLSHLK